MCIWHENAKNVQYFANIIESNHFVCAYCINLLFKYDDTNQRYIDVFVEMTKILRNTYFDGAIGDDEFQLFCNGHVQMQYFILYNFWNIHIFLNL